MRIWTLHPRHLDPQGLVALWRETLLAQQVLAGNTRGYTARPQLARFRAHPAPLAAVAAYLTEVQAEATARGYRFDASKIITVPGDIPITVTTGQIAHEWQHLLGKLRRRSPRLAEQAQHDTATLHPMFTLIDGPIEPWEILSDVVDAGTQSPS